MLVASDFVPPPPNPGRLLFDWSPSLVPLLAVGLTLAVSFLVTTESTEDGLDLMRRTVTARGALTAAVYSTDEKVVAAARSVALDAGVALSENLTGLARLVRSQSLLSA